MIIATSTAHIRVNTSSDSRIASDILTLIWRSAYTSTGTYTISAGIICGALVMIIATSTAHIRVNTISGSRIASEICLTLIWSAYTSTGTYTINAGIICGTSISIITRLHQHYFSILQIHRYNHLVLQGQLCYQQPMGKRYHSSIPTKEWHSKTKHSRKVIQLGKEKEENIGNQREKSLNGNLSCPFSKVKRDNLFLLFPIVFLVYSLPNDRIPSRQLFFVSFPFLLFNSPSEWYQIHKKTNKRRAEHKKVKLASLFGFGLPSELIRTVSFSENRDFTISKIDFPPTRLKTFKQFQKL
jgi:hypothetical protein